MIVYGASLSPFVRKVLAFAAEKGIEVEHKALPPNTDDPGFLEASPFRKIPGFRDGDFAISDSSAIIFYLDAIQPEPVLIPSEPRARARTIWYDEFADTIFAACGAKMFFNRIVAPLLGREADLSIADKAECEELPPLLDYVEKMLPESGWLVGDRLTLADISVASPLVNLHHLGVDFGAGRPKLAAFADRMLARDSFRPWIEKETVFLKRAA